MIHNFNKTMEYIEEILDDEIDEKRIAQLSGYSYAMFGRIFSMLVGYPLSEYIRLRRLSCAAQELQNNPELRVIDVAVKYGYDSADAFASAFKKFHHKTPSDVKNGEKYQIFTPIILSLTIEGGKKMDTRIERKKAFTIAGVKAEGISSEQCSQIWKKLFEKASFEKLVSLGNGESYGACFEINDPNSINYMAGFHVQDKKEAERLGLDFLEVPDAEYAVVKLKGAIPASIHAGWDYVMRIFLPSQNYVHAGSPDFEFYFEGDMYDEKYEMELWVPIVKK